LQAQDQQRLMTQTGVVEAALPLKHQDLGKGKESLGGKKHASCREISASNHTQSNGKNPQKNCP